MRLAIKSPVQQTHYANLAEGYITFWKKRPEAHVFAVPAVNMEIAGLPVKASTEVGMTYQGDTMPLKLYFRATPPTRRFRQAESVARPADWWDERGRVHHVHADGHPVRRRGLLEPRHGRLHAAQLGRKVAQHALGENPAHSFAHSGRGTRGLSSAQECTDSGYLPGGEGATVHGKAWVAGDLQTPALPLGYVAVSS